MRKILLTLIVLLACKLTSFASHIVGGEFELLYLQDYEFSLNMIMYFDEKNGAAGAREESIIVYIYRKHDNTLMGSYTLNKTIDQLVPYSNIECSDGQLITSRLYYSNIITLPPSQFDHPDGYYVAYERCCRNYTINNIESAIPGSGISAGQTFYLEFPPVVKEGVPFINSTPRLFPPLRDYGCVDKFYFADFGGIDDDGDSLVYTMVTPYSTIDTQLAYPVTPNSGPY
ncbi:MAG: gliding motility-associated C-terminal domain-containing protein, partial [Fulvivirga sp.]